MILKDRNHYKILSSDEVNYFFDKQTGLMCTWGKTHDDNPDYSP